MPTLTFKVSPREAATIRRAAREQRISFSTYARRMFLGGGKDKSDLVGKTSIRPGRVVIATPPMTREAIAAALYDY